MKVTFVLPPVNMGGGIKVISIYAKALVENGHAVTLISTPPQDIPLRRKIKSFILGNGWPKNRRAQSHIDGLGLNHIELDRWRHITDTDVPDADIVIATWWETAEWVNELSERKGVKVYFIQHHEIHSYLPIDRCHATYKMPLHKIVVAKWLKNIMYDIYGDDDVDVVPNGVDHSQFFSNTRGKQPVPTVGFLYSRSSYKGVDVTKQVIHKLREIFPSLRVIVFGAYNPEEDIKFYSKVEFFCSPKQEKIREIYSQCDVWITASRSEGFNLPAMEAMACRTPVVSTRAGWPEEAIINGLNGFLADVDDTNVLIQGASLILSLPEEAWREMSNSAYTTVKSCSCEKSAEQFEKALERIWINSKC